MSRELIELNALLTPNARSIYKISGEEEIYNVRMDNFLESYISRVHEGNDNVFSQYEIEDLRKILETIQKSMISEKFVFTVYEPAGEPKIKIPLKTSMSRGLYDFEGERAVDRIVLSDISSGINIEMNVEQIEDESMGIQVPSTYANRFSLNQANLTVEQVVSSD